MIVYVTCVCVCESVGGSVVMGRRSRPMRFMVGLCCCRWPA